MNCSHLVLKLRMCSRKTNYRTINFFPMCIDVARYIFYFANNT